MENSRNRGSRRGQNSSLENEVSVSVAVAAQGTVTFTGDLSIFEVVSSFTDRETSLNERTQKENEV